MSSPRKRKRSNHSDTSNFNTWVVDSPIVSSPHFTDRLIPLTVNGDFESHHSTDCLVDSEESTSSLLLDHLRPADVQNSNRNGPNSNRNGPNSNRNNRIYDTFILKNIPYSPSNDDHIVSSIYDNHSSLRSSRISLDLSSSNHHRASIVTPSDQRHRIDLDFDDHDDLDMWNEAWREATTTDRPPPPIYGHHANPALHRRQSMDMMTPRRGHMKQAHTVAPIPSIRRITREHEMMAAEKDKRQPSSKCCCGLVGLRCACFLLAVIELICLTLPVADNASRLMHGENAAYNIGTLVCLLVVFVVIVGLVVGVARRITWLLVVHMIVQMLLILGMLFAAIMLIVSVAMGSEVFIRVVNTSPTMAKEYMTPTTASNGDAQPRVANAGVGPFGLVEDSLETPHVLQERSPQRVFGDSHSADAMSFVSPALRLVTLAVALLLLLGDVLLVWGFSIVFRCHRHIKYTNSLGDGSTQSSSLDEQSPRSMKR